MRDRALNLNMVFILIFGLLLLLCSTRVQEIRSELTQLKAERQQQPTQTDFVAFCQQLSAETANPGWKYDNCLNQLMESVKGKGVRML